MNKKKATTRKHITFSRYLQLPQCSILSGEKNDLLFVIIDIDTFLGNKTCYKAVTNFQSKDVSTVFQLS